MSVKNISLSLMMVWCAFSASAQRKEALLQQENILKTMQRVAGWQINSWNKNGFKRKKWDWTNGAAYVGLVDFGKLGKNDTCLKYLVSIGNDLNWNTGPHRQFADDYCVGQTFAQLYSIYHDDKMIAKFRAQADSIVAAPHTEGLQWHNNINQREWAWCDALFMGPPALGALSTATKDAKYLDKACQLWWKTTAFLYDTTEHLYFRDESYFAKTEKNGKKVFWSRGNGWVMGGLVRLLDNMPANHPERKKLLELYKQMAARVVALQQPDGTWHASLLDPDSYPIAETSGTGFYAYAILWGLNHGVLDIPTYAPVAMKAWTALAAAVQPDGMLGYVQPIGAAPDKVDQSSTAAYGVGAFLLTGTQLYKYLGYVYHTNRKIGKYIPQ